MPRFAAALVLCLLALPEPAMTRADTPGPADLPGTWVLAELGGAPFAARATLVLTEPGRLAGEAPCNRYAGPVAGPLPAFRPGPLLATRRACADLAAETAYLAALGAVEHAELTGGRLVLTGPDGVRLVFRPD